MLSCGPQLWFLAHTLSALRLSLWPSYSTVTLTPHRLRAHPNSTDSSWRSHPAASRTIMAEDELSVRGLQQDGVGQSKTAYQRINSGIKRNQMQLCVICAVRFSAKGPNDKQMQQHNLLIFLKPFPHFVTSQPQTSTYCSFIEILCD